MNEQYRQLSSSERQLIDQLLSEDFPGRDAIRAQIAFASAREIDASGSLELAVPQGSPPAITKFRVPIEGWSSDSDGVHIHVLLHVVNGAVNEVEVYKDDGSPIVNMPEAGRLTIFRPE